MVFTFSVSITAGILLKHIPNTTISVVHAQHNVTICRSILSEIISANITRNIMIAMICAAITKPPF